MSIDYQPLYDTLATTDLAPWLDDLPSRVNEAIFESNNGHFPKWKGTLDQLPDVTPSEIDLAADAVTIGKLEDISPEERLSVREKLLDFHPWRKGPFSLFGTYIDTEWRSNLKWTRLEPHLPKLDGRLVFDVGCGNGYYGWRMAGKGAQVVGIDPYLLFVMQQQVTRRYIDPSIINYVLPFGLENAPSAIPAFDTVLSMGVLYHRRSPIDHLMEMGAYLRPGGELVLETIVVDGPDGHALLPKGRYAKMRNVWFIPSALTLESWLKRCGYKEVRIVDISTTGSDEQRSTDWMRFESLKDYLDPNDDSKTIEGYPAPKRAIAIARK